PDRTSDILELPFAEFDQLFLDPVAHLAIGVLGQTDRAWPSDSFQPSGDIHAVAHQIAVALLHHIAEMDADAELNPSLLRQPRVALDHAVLHFDRATHRVDHTTEFDDAAVAGALDDAAAVGGDRRVDEIAAKSSEPRKRPLLVDPGQPAIADDVGDQNRC